MECQLPEVGGLAVCDSRVLLAVPEAELQLESCPVIFQDIKCRLVLVCREVELPFVSPVFNGREVREHSGGFTRWETDITPFVKAGAANEIQLEVTDRIDDPSYASGYAHHPVGGILRDVTVFALPQTYLYDISVETDLDASYRDAVLAFSASVETSSDAEVRYRLTSPSGEDVPLEQSAFRITEDEDRIVHRLPVSNPLKWDAEHPHLYTLTVSLWQDGGETSRFSKKIGFREVVIAGDRMLVNGMPVKLRGACRHDIHPVLGRMTTPELDSLDAVLFKRANMNFVRTSHYPPGERFLDWCDSLGIYVECETAILTATAT